MAISTGSLHYKKGKIEPLELIEAQELNFHLGNVVKYVVRANYYAPLRLVLESVDKAVWYLLRYKELITSASTEGTNTQPTIERKVVLNGEKRHGRPAKRRTRQRRRPSMGKTGRQARS